jgi:hypothetical protein
MRTPAITHYYPKHNFKEKFYLGFLYKRKRIAIQVVLLVKSKHWVPAKIQFIMCLVFFSKILALEFFFLGKPPLCCRRQPNAATLLPPHYRHRYADAITALPCLPPCYHQAAATTTATTPPPPPPPPPELPSCRCCHPAAAVAFIYIAR